MPAWGWLHDDGADCEVGTCLKFFFDAMNGHRLVVVVVEARPSRDYASHTWHVACKPFIFTAYRKKITGKKTLKQRHPPFPFSKQTSCAHNTMRFTCKVTILAADFLALGTSAQL